MQQHPCRCRRSHRPLPTDPPITPRRRSRPCPHPPPRDPPTSWSSAGGSPGSSPQARLSPPESASSSSTRSRARNLGGQAWWSFGGLFFIDSPEQRRMGIKDSLELARQDWFGNAGFDRDEDAWPRRWAEAYLAVRSRGEARVAAREGRGVLPRRRLGRARRLHRHRPGQLGSPLPHHLGHRARASSRRSRQPWRRARPAAA